MEMHHDGLSRPLESPRLRLLSLGNGVQSSTLALMSARGDIEPYDYAITADLTESEPKAVGEWALWLEKQLPFPVIRVSAGSLKDNITKAATWSDGRFVTVPFFTSGGGMVRRQCTKEFKIEPIEKEVRRLLGLKPRQHGPRVPVVETSIGISTDEISRMKESRKNYIQHRWPLIEARMSRRDCETWLRERQYPTPPKSACVFCPYRSNANWRDLKNNAPDDFAEAVRIDALIRVRGTMNGLDQSQFVHRDLVPLDQVNFERPEDPLLGFDNECDGMCGV